MAATLPISAAAERRAPRTTPQTQPFGATAPSATLPLVFTLTGLLALFVCADWLVVQPEILAQYHYTPRAIAVTHLFVLGWLGSIVMGAMYQLVPVALETKLFSERLAKIHFAFHLAGFVGMVAAFSVWNLQFVALFGSVLAVGVGLFVYNLARTLARVPKWNVIATSVASAISWVPLAVAAGLVIVLARTCSESLPVLAGWVFRFDPLGAMHAHAHLGAVGFFLILIVGVSYKLIPMFTLSELQNPRRASWSVWLLNLGLAGVFVTILGRSPWKLAFAFVILAALALYALEVRAILRARKRAAMDGGVRGFLTALSFLFPLAILGVVLAWPNLPVNSYTLQLENVYGWLGLVGAVTFAVIGMLYKIIPFIVWFGTYSPHIGRAQVPSLADLFSARLQRISYWIFLAGLFTTLGAMELSSVMAVRIGTGLLAAGLAVFGVNVATMLRHFVRPQLKPLAKISTHRPAL